MSKVFWNHHLDNTIRACQRKGFYTELFASHQSKDGTIRREVFLLKNAIDVPLWRGNIVHLVLEEVVIPTLKKGQAPDFEEAKTFALELIEKQRRFSRNENYRNFSKSSKKYEFCVLKSDYLGEGLSLAELDLVKQEVLTALNNLENKYSDLLERIRKAKKVEVEKELHPKIDGNIQIDTKIDCLFIEYDDKVVIVDWKVSEGYSGNAREQLHTYAYAAIKSNYWGHFFAEDIELIEANLLTGERTTYPLSEEDLDDVDDRIFNGSQLLKQLYERPVGKYKAEDFAPANSTGTCEWCAVKEICNGNLFTKISKSSKQPGLF